MSIARRRGAYRSHVRAARLRGQELALGLALVLFGHAAHDARVGRRGLAGIGLAARAVDDGSARRQARALRAVPALDLALIVVVPLVVAALVVVVDERALAALGDAADGVGVRRRHAVARVRQARDQIG